MKSNNLAIVYLNISVESAKTTAWLKEACYDKYLKGLSHVAWKNVYKNYAKTDKIWSSKFIQELHLLNPKKEGNTTNFFEKISTIQIEARKITDENILDKEINLKIITASPKMYMQLIRTLQKEKESNLNIENLEE